MSSVEVKEGRMSGGAVTVGVDIGGTFTDLVVVDSGGEVRIAKVASTPPDYAVGVTQGLEKLGVAGTTITRFAHGTTAATNAILTKSGAATGLLTTRGFRDVLEIRRANRGDLFNYWWRPPKPLVTRQDRLQVTERIGFDGAVVNELVENEVAQAIESFRARGIKSLAICFLNSFVNGAHERRVKEIVEEMWPDVYVCASVDIAPEILEFERMSTTVANAYVGPTMEAYLGALLSNLRSAGYAGEVLVMASSGNVMTIAAALEAPITTATSGIAAGAMAGAALSEVVSRPNLITLDVGGTSSDIALIREGRPRLTTEWFIEFGLPIRLPAIDIHTIGAGGGSIAAVDAGGVLHVGPASAGAVPGPACYGRGGDKATTTDAQALLGRLDLDRWHELYGWQLDVESAERAVARVGDALGVPTVEAAAAILDVTVNNLVEAIRLVSVERGYDPRDFALAAYGGAGPMFGVDIARELEIPEVIVPPMPGVTSAIGLLQVDLAVRAQRSVLMVEDALDVAEINRLFGVMEEESTTRVSGGGETEPTVSRQVDVRYFGQSRYLTVDAPGGEWTDVEIATVIGAFSKEHEREYGYTMPPHVSKIEFANLRVVAELKVDRARPRLAFSPTESVCRREVYFKGAGFLETPVYQRSAMPPGTVIDGPALIEQTDSTILLPPAAQGTVVEGGSLVIRVSPRPEDGK
jgi:N-methylhydantoinase A